MRQPVPAGTIPRPPPLTIEDEQYGHDVLSELTEKFPLDQNDARIERSRKLVDKLTGAIGASKDPWHVYVLKADSVKNAAATRGNHIFIWSGMLNAVPDDQELSVVIAHEIAHVLAEHARLNSNEEASQIMSQVVGGIAQNAAIYNGSVEVVANLAAALAQEAVGALIINPEAQRKELEADLIGIHLMAEAKIDPRIALAFWQKNLNNPDFESGLPQFLSSHPSSNERLLIINKNLPAAVSRYERARGFSLSDSGSNRSLTFSKDSFDIGTKRPVSKIPARENPRAGLNLEEWQAVDTPADVYSNTSTNSKVLKTLHPGQLISVSGRVGRWLKVESPLKGYVWGPKFAPKS